jgi:hypothetical protein
LPTTKLTIPVVNDDVGIRELGECGQMMAHERNW